MPEVELLFRVNLIRARASLCLAAGGSPGESHLGVPAGAPAAPGLDVTGRGPGGRGTPEVRLGSPSQNAWARILLMRATFWSWSLCFSYKRDVNLKGLRHFRNKNLIVDLTNGESSFNQEPLNLITIRFNDVKGKKKVVLFFFFWIIVCQHCKIWRLTYSFLSDVLLVSTCERLHIHGVSRESECSFPVAITTSCVFEFTERRISPGIHDMKQMKVLQIPFSVLKI